MGDCRLHKKQHVLHGAYLVDFQTMCPRTELARGAAGRAAGHPPRPRARRGAVTDAALLPRQDSEGGARQSGGRHRPEAAPAAARSRTRQTRTCQVNK